jgi:RHS repeat-associated protein
MTAQTISRLVAAALTVALVAAACGTSQPSPSPSTSAAPSSSAAGPSALDECDPGGFIACNQQAAFISLPIADTGLSLTWSSQWAPGRTDRAGWDATTLGLGGWSIDVVQRYRGADQALISGDGTWRFATTAKLPSGGFAVPSYDGSVAYLFDSGGRHVTTVDGHLGTTSLTLTYDSAGRLATISGTSGGQPSQLEVRRAADGTPQGLVGLDGAVTTLGVDVNGNLTSVTDPAGHPTTLAWAPGGLVTSETDPLGGVSRFTYDQDGRLVAASDADGVTAQFSRSATAGSVEVKVTSALGRTITYRSTSGSGGITRSVVAADGTTTTEATAADGSRSVSLPDGTARTIGLTASSVWGTAAPLLTPDVTKRPDGVTSTTAVTEALTEIGGLPYTVSGMVSTTINGATSVETFDPGARTATTVDGAGRRTVDTYDPAGRLVSESAPGRAPTTYTYDPQGRETSQTLGTGSAAQTTHFGYDASTGQITVTRADGSTIAMSVDANGSVATTATADGATEVLAYDASGRLTRVQPAGGLSFTTGYSAAGRSTAFIPPPVPDDASARVIAYDADGEATSVSGLGVDDSLTYDSAGRLVATTTDAGQTTHSFAQATGLESSSTDPDGVSTAYGYSGSQLTALSWSGPLTGSASITLDANGRAVTQEADTAAPLDLTYDAAGDLASVGSLSLTRDATTGLATGSIVGTVSTQQQYDAADQLVRSVTTVGGRSVLDLAYTRDARGLIVGVVERSAAGTTTTAYTFDGSDRLSTVQVNGKTIEKDAYDAAGNRSATIRSSGTTKGTYDARDRLASWAGATYTWRADGGLATVKDPAGTTTFSYDDGGTLRSVMLADGRAIHYLVDADGRRVGREVRGQLVAGYLYDPTGRVVAETDGAGAVTEQFGYDDQGHLAVVEKGGRTYRVITDPVGSPRLVIDAQTGSVADAITFDAWGQVTSETAPGFIPFGFAGGLADPDTGLVHFGARDYDPTTGRWTGPDPIGFDGGDGNLYRYAGGDPVNRVDPTGLCIGPIFWLPCAGFALWKISQPSNPSPPPSQPSTGDCVGVACSLPNGSACTGTAATPCALWPTGCIGVTCQGPHGEACAGTADVPCSAQWGDTHVLTADRTHFDFQAAGEFLVATSPNHALHIEVRQEAALGGTLITFNTAVAASVDGDRVGVYADEPSFLMVNGKPVSAVDVAEQLPHGGSLERHGGLVSVRWPDGTALTVVRDANTLNYWFVPSAAVAPTVTGLLGNADGNPANDLTGRDGTILSLSDPDFHTKLYAQFGNSWRITQAESLFDYWPGESTATFTKLNIPSAEVTVSTLDPAARSMAQGVCSAVGVRTEPLLDDCLIDVAMTGDASFAAATAAVAAAGGAQETASSAPPASVTPITIGQTISGTIASPTQQDDYTFTGTSGQIVYLRTHATCAGSLTWALLAPDGHPLAGSLVCNDLERVVLPSEGTYTVRINGDRSASGAYAFSVLAVPATVVTPISAGQTVSASLTAAGQWADYTFDGAAGQVVYLQRGATCSQHLLWDLLGPTGGPVASTIACNDLGRAILPTAGTYTVRIYGDHASTGAYTFTLLAVPATVVTPILVGQTVNGSLTAAGQWADYTFTATAGESVTLKAQGACVDGLGWQLRGPAGNLLDFTVACHVMGPDRLDAAGTYTIRMAGSGTATGAYSFTLQSGN